MRIDKLEIKNFKGFDNKTLEFPAQFTVIIGENGAGKTSVLEALCVAAGSFLLGIEGADSRTIRENEIRSITIDNQPRPQKPVVIQATWIHTEEDKERWKFRETDYKYREDQTLKNENSNEELPYILEVIEEFLMPDDLWGNLKLPKTTWKREVTNKNTTTKDARKISDFAKYLLHKSRTPTSEKVIFPVIAYYSTARLWAEHEKVNYVAQSEGTKMAYSNCLSEKSSSKEFLSWFKTQEDSISKFNDSLEIAHLEAFKQTIYSLLPEKSWVDIKFDRKKEELVGLFKDESTNTINKLKYSQLSDGYRNVIGLAADIAYRCIQLNPHLGENAVIDTPGMVLIDELDLHLHPNWQKRIVGDLKRTFPKIQFVATTHSPFIVQSLKEEELINLNENEVEGIEGDFFKRSVEDVAEYEMGVENVQRSELFLEMEKVAGEYFELIKQGKTSKSHAKTAQLRQRLNELEVFFGEDAAFVALLKSRRAGDL